MSKIEEFRDRDDQLFKVLKENVPVSKSVDLASSVEDALIEAIVTLENEPDAQMEGQEWKFGLH